MLLASSPIDVWHHDPERPPEPTWVTEDEHVSLTEAIAAAFQQSHYSALRSLEVSVSEGVVVLEGVVASFHLKQLAQQAVLRVLARAMIRNELEVSS